MANKGESVSAVESWILDVADLDRVLEKRTFVHVVMVSGGPVFVSKL